MPDDAERPQPVLEYAKPEKPDREGPRLLKASAVSIIAGVILTVLALTTDLFFLAYLALPAFVFGLPLGLIGIVSEVIYWLRTR